jgi:hypothetical protein
MKDKTSSTSKTRKLLIFQEAKMKKEERSLSTEDTEVLVRDGQSAILTPRVLRKLLQDSTENGVCISTDCSTLDQDSQ